MSFRWSKNRCGTIKLVSSGGVSIKAGQVYVAPLSSGGADGLLGCAVDGGERFAMNEVVKEPARVFDLADRIRQYLAHHGVDQIVLVDVRKRGDWKYSDAYTHVMAVAAVMSAAHQLDVTVHTVTTEKVAKIVDTKADELKKTDFTRFGHSVRPKYWTAGMGAAFAGAAYGLALRGEISGIAANG